MHIHAGGVLERLAAHGRSDHADRHVSRALERRTAAQVDDVLAALDDPLLQRMPVLDGHLRTDQLRKGLAVHERRRSEDGHLLPVAAVGAAVLHLVGRNSEISGQLRTQTRGVEGREGRDLRGFQPRIDQRHQPRDVGRVEDHHHVLYVGTVGPEVLAELRGDLGVAFEQVLARHAGLAGGAARRYDVRSAPQRLPDVGGPRDVHPFETAVVQLFGHAFERRTERVVKADVGRQAHHQRRLGHVRADHAGRTHNGKLFSCYEIHDFIV